jgi:hypothetical protein
MPTPVSTLDIAPFASASVDDLVATLEKSADNHATEQGNLDYAIGDHLESLRAALLIMTDQQRLVFAAERAPEIEPYIYPTREPVAS